MMIYFQLLFRVDKEKISVLINRFGSEEGFKKRLIDIVIRIIDEEYEIAQREKAEFEISKEVKL